jgi:hypothetical protein
MSYHSPRQSQTQFPFNPSTPPPPPPKPSAHLSGQGTLQPPLPPLPPGQQYCDQQQVPSQQFSQSQLQQNASQNGFPLPEDGWLPDIVKDKTYVVSNIQKENAQVSPELLTYIISCKIPSYNMPYSTIPKQHTLRSLLRPHQYKACFLPISR